MKQGLELFYACVKWHSHLTCIFCNDRSPSIVTQILQWPWNDGLLQLYRQNAKAVYIGDRGTVSSWS